MQTRKTVVFGFAGTNLDEGKHQRWQRWRPTIALCQQPDLIVHRLELIHDENSADLFQRLMSDVAQVSPETEVRGHNINFKNPWDFGEVYEKIHEFAKNYKFDTDNEDYIVNITTGTHVAQICWFLLVEARYIPGKLVQISPSRRSDKDNGIGTCTIIDLDLSRYDRIATRFRLEQQEAASFLKSGIETRNPTFNRMIDQIEKVAVKSRAPVLLTGPTGAGKSHLARRIYDLKKTRHQLKGGFVEVNCATLRGDSAMSALFGHVRGAFTGAAADRAGLLKSANGGLLFLDEIGELGADEQAMILRAIEEKRFLPVGADRETTSDFQLIAGTNRDLAQDVRTGKFREDLFARLNLWTFTLPALQQRPEDIEPNLRFELRRFAEREGRNVSFNREAETSYLSFAKSPEALWTANFRDLAASITRMATLAPAGRIREEEVNEEISRLRSLWQAKSQDQTTDILTSLLEPAALSQIDLFDRIQLEEVIKVCRHSASLSAAGRTLFAASRMQKTSGNDADRLRKYLARFGLDWTKLQPY
jgi:transcriptional regulatory protein RtcR